jgi:TolB-like protein
MSTELPQPIETLSLPERIQGFESLKLIEQAKKVLHSRAFARSKRLSDLFLYLFSETVRERGEEISQYSIAYDCFRIGRSFDASRDSLIRTHIRRLRVALADYYETATNDPIHFSLKQGGYQLVFLDRTFVSTRSTFDQQKPTVAILTFGAVNLKETLEGVPLVLGDELVFALGSHPQLKVIGPLKLKASETAEAKVKYASSLGASLLLDGSISQQGDQLVVNMRLYSTDQHKQIWIERTAFENNLGEVLKLSHKVCREIASNLASEHGVIASLFTDLAEVKPQHSRTVFDAVMLGWLALRDFRHQHIIQAVDALRYALKLESREALLHSTLAILLAAAPAQPKWQGGFSLAEIKANISSAERLAPNSPWTKCAQAFYFAAAGEDAELVTLAQSLKSGSEVNQTAIGATGLLLCLRRLEMQLGTELIDIAVAMNPHFPTALLLGKALVAVERGNLEEIRFSIQNVVPYYLLPKFKGSETPEDEDIAVYPTGGWGVPLIVAYSHAMQEQHTAVKFYWKVFLACFEGDLEKGLKCIHHFWSDRHLDKIMSAIRPSLSA